MRRSTTFADTSRQHPEGHLAIHWASTTAAATAECPACQAPRPGGKNFLGFRNCSDRYFEWCNQIVEGVLQTVSRQGLRLPGLQRSRTRRKAAGEGPSADHPLHDLRSHEVDQPRSSRRRPTHDPPLVKGLPGAGLVRLYLRLPLLPAAGVVPPDGRRLSLRLRQRRAGPCMPKPIPTGAKAPSSMSP